MNFLTALPLIALLAIGANACSEEEKTENSQTDVAFDAAMMADGSRATCLIVTDPQIDRVAWRCDPAHALLLTQSEGQLALTEITVPTFGEDLTADLSQPVQGADAKAAFGAITDKLRSCLETEGCSDGATPPAFITALQSDMTYINAVDLTLPKTPGENAGLSGGLSGGLGLGGAGLGSNMVSRLHLFASGACTFAALERGLLIPPETAADAPRLLVVFEASGKAPSCLK